MWPTIIQAAGVIAAALIAKTFFVSPESRHVRRIQAYLDIRAKLGDDKSLVAHVDDLITRAINAEVRARTPGRWFRSTWVVAAGWVAAFLAFGGAVFMAVRGSVADTWSVIFAALAALGAGLAARRAYQAYIQASGEHAELAGLRLIEMYAQHARQQGRTATLSSGAGDEGFDLLVSDKDGKVLEVVESKTARHPNPQSLLRARLWARNVEPSAAFVILMPTAPPHELRSELTRLGILVAYPRSDGSFETITQ